MYKTFVRSVLVMLCVSATFYAAELAFEWWRLGMPGADAMSWAGTNNTKLLDLMSPVARAYNNVLAMLIATIGLAIPLTANMHTPKLIDMFLSDRLNQTVLSIFAILAANTLWVAAMVGPDFAPMFAIRLALGGALIGWAMLVPYFFYVVRFLDPSNIVERLRRDVMRAIDRVAARQLDPNDAQAIVHERLHQIGTIVIKSLDRGDRGVALEGIWAIKRLLDHHGEVKGKMPEGWFEVDRADFIGLSDEALSIVQSERTFFEHKALQQLYLAHAHAVTKVPDAVSAVSDATRVVALVAAERGDERALELCVRFFNNYLRESLRHKHAHSIYDVFYQYRQLAIAILPKYPAVAREIAQSMRYYVDIARRGGLSFVASLAVFDLAQVAAAACQDGGEDADAVLDQTLAIPHDEGGKVDELVVEAKLKLGGILTKIGAEQAADKVRATLSSVDGDDLQRAARVLLDAPRSFHEVTARQEDLRWIAPDEREALSRFVARTAGASA